MNIQGQTALVTGGGSGLGEATARELASLGARVAVLDINLANAQRVASDICQQAGADAAIACQCDITNTDSVQAALAQVADKLGVARILMNIAGIGSAKRIVGKDGNAAALEDFARVVNVNLIGTYNASRLFAAECAKLPVMEDGERGVMMFTASVAAFDGQVGQQAYSASKAAVIRLTESMAAELREQGVNVNCVMPTIIDTPVNRADMPDALYRNVPAVQIIRAESAQSRRLDAEKHALRGDRRWIAARSLARRQAGHILRFFGRIRHVVHRHADVFSRPVFAIQRCDGAAQRTEQLRRLVGFGIAPDHRLAAAQRQVGQIGRAHV